MSPRVLRSISETMWPWCFVFLLYALTANSQDAGWGFGTLYYGAQQVRSAYTFQNSGNTHSEITKSDKSVLGAEGAFDYYTPKWALSSALGYTRSKFSFSNYTPGSTVNRRVSRSLDTSTYYLAFTPRYRAGEVFYIGPRLQIYPSKSAFHPESNQGVGSFLVYTGADASFEYPMRKNSLVRFGLFALLDVNEPKRTTIFVSAYLGFAFNLFDNTQDPAQALGQRPLLKLRTTGHGAHSPQNVLRRTPTVFTESPESVSITLPASGFLLTQTLSGASYTSKEALHYVEEMATVLRESRGHWKSIEIIGLDSFQDTQIQQDKNTQRWASEVRAALQRGGIAQNSMRTSNQPAPGSQRGVRIIARTTGQDSTSQLLESVRALHRRMGYEP